MLVPHEILIVCVCVLVCSQGTDTEVCVGVCGCVGQYCHGTETEVWVCVCVCVGQQCRGTETEACVNPSVLLWLSLLG